MEIRALSRGACSFSFTRQTAALSGSRPASNLHILFSNKPGEVESIKRLVVTDISLQFSKILSQITHFLLRSSKNFVICRGCNGFTIPSSLPCKLTPSLKTISISICPISLPYVLCKLLLTACPAPASFSPVLLRSSLSIDTSMYTQDSINIIWLKRLAATWILTRVNKLHDREPTTIHNLASKNKK